MQAGISTVEVARTHSVVSLVAPQQFLRDSFIWTSPQPQPIVLDRRNVSSQRLHKRQRRRTLSHAMSWPTFDIPLHLQPYRTLSYPTIPYVSQYWVTFRSRKAADSMAAGAPLFYRRPWVLTSACATLESRVHFSRAGTDTDPHEPARHVTFSMPSSGGCLLYTVLPLVVGGWGPIPPHSVRRSPVAGSIACIRPDLVIGYLWLTNRQAVDGSWPCARGERGPAALVTDCRLDTVHTDRYILRRRLFVELVLSRD